MTTLMTTMRIGSLLKYHHRVTLRRTQVTWRAQRHMQTINSLCVLLAQLESRLLAMVSGLQTSLKATSLVAVVRVTGWLANFRHPNGSSGKTSRKIPRNCYTWQQAPTESFHETETRKDPAMRSLFRTSRALKLGSYHRKVYTYSFLVQLRQITFSSLSA